MNYYLLDDMEKYFPNFNRSEYEHMSEEELIPICRQYYAEHLPVDVTTWIRVNEPDEKLIYKKGQGRQVCFIRDDIMRNMFFNLENKDLNGKYDHDRYESFQPRVISTHHSKSVLLPVMEIELKSVGIKMVFRDNFYCWNISIESENPIEFEHKGLINDDSYHYCFCEGFPKDRIHGKYLEDHKKFTMYIRNDYDLYTFMFLLRDYLYGLSSNK